MPDRDIIQEQYEGYPYPERNPRDEAKRLITGSPGHLDEIRHYLFAGKINRDKPFRVLIAGGGTGDAAIMIAQQMTDTGLDGEVVYLDLSTASRKVAEARAEARGLNNISFHTGRLEAVSDLCPGPYDYVDCCGVLHHLPDPAEGLRALTEALSDDGGMGLMVYGELGRTGVYHIQDALRLLADDQGDPDRVKLAGKLLKSLPETNWLRRNPFVGDHLEGGEAGIYDLLLHRRDQAYRVSGFLDLIASGGLDLVTFLPSAIYDPATFSGDPVIQRQMAGLSERERMELAELLYGAITKHVAYVTKPGSGARTASADDLSMIPVLNGLDASAVAQSVRKSGQLQAELNGFNYRAALPRLAPAVLSRIDGDTSLKDIFTALKTGNSQLDENRFRQTFDEIYTVFNGINRMLLKQPDN